MVDGVLLVRGMIVQYLVGVEITVELVHATVQHQSMEVMIVPLMVQLIQKPKDATKIRVQVRQSHNLKSHMVETE